MGHRGVKLKREMRAGEGEIDGKIRYALLIIPMLLTVLPASPVLEGASPSTNCFSEAPGSPVEVLALRPRAITIGDFNSDGQIDLAVASLRCDPERDPRDDCEEWSTSGQVSILIGDDTGRFAEFQPGQKSPFRISGDPQAIVAADLDGDGQDELITAHLTKDKLNILWSEGRLDFARPVHLYVTGAPMDVAVGDFNEDGSLDIVTANVVGDSISLLLGGKAGEPRHGYGYGFNASRMLALKVANGPKSLAVGDLNGDGHLDIAVANSSKERSISVLLGDGTGGFAVASIGLGTVPRAIAIADFNGDGHPDLATANPGPNTVSILLGRGDGSFAKPKSFPAGIDPIAVASGDFNSDGAPDLAVISGSRDELTLLINDRNGRFEPARSLPTGRVPVALVVEDFNRDGKPDLAIANGASNDVTVLLGS